MPSIKSKAVRLSHFVIGAINRRKSKPGETPDAILRRILHLPDRKGNMPPQPRRFYIASCGPHTATGKTPQEARGHLLLHHVLEVKKQKDDIQVAQFEELL